MSEVLALAIEPRDARRIWLIRRKLINLELVLGGKSVQPPCPALAAPDHCGLNQQALPFPWRSQRASEHGMFAIDFCSCFVALINRAFLQCEGAFGKNAEDFIAGGDPIRLVRLRRVARVQWRHLAEGEILG